VLDEQRVERDPVLRVDRPGEGPLGLLRRSRSDDPEPVRDPVDVRVDRDRRDPVAEDKDAVGRLGPDALQGRQLVERPGDHAPEAVEEVPGDLVDDPRLRVVESGPSDERLDRGRRSGGERWRVGVPGEQERARHVRRFVPRPLREDRPDQDLERVLGVVAEVRRAPVTGAVERRETVEEGLPVERRGAHRAVPRRAGGAAEESVEVGAGSPTPGSERSGSSASPLGRMSSPTR
jgi:hypothetical protein